METKVETTDVEKFKKRTPSAIRCLAFFKAKEGKGGELERVLLGLVEPTRAEPGNIAYVLHRSTKSADELVFDEVWADIRALDDHGHKPYIRSLWEKIQHLADAPPVIGTYVEVR